MKITDKQFIEAMHSAVERKGNWHTAASTYWDQGGPACIVGYALALISLGLCPSGNYEMADALLVRYGVSKRVAHAAHIAQFLQDSRRPWGECLVAFEAARRIWTPEMSRQDLLDRAVAETRVAPLHSIEFTFKQSLISDEAFSLLTGMPMPTPTVVTKKEHALVA
jgi:hypothetical protein